MDDAKVAFASLLGSILLLLAGMASHADVEYIAPEQRETLEKLFQQAEFQPARDTKKINEGKWTCDMYGMRTGLQVQHGVKLYKLASAGGEWHNEGAQLISSYKAAPHELLGQSARFEDHVKLTADGRLISQLKLNSTDKTVIAYSICKNL
jgi:hypothetical protein